jgi:hypothetical protein
MIRGRTTSLLTSALVLATLLPLAGCSLSSGSDDPPSTGATGGRRHDPSPAEIDSLRGQLAALDGVTKVSKFDYRKGTFGNGPATDGTFDSDATSQQELVRILDNAYRLTWFRSDIAMGTLIYIVRNPATGAEAGSSDLGFKIASIGPRELQDRYGPAPATPPAAEPT